MSCKQIGGHNHNVKITKKLFENVATFKYLDMTLKIKTYTHKEIKRLHFGIQL
jgi:protein associated with RNAse G/E